jgi:hypothetical protein
VLTLLVTPLVLLCVKGPLLPPFIGREDMSWVRKIEQDNSTGHEWAEGVVATEGGFSVIGYTNSRQPGVDLVWVLQFGDAPPPRWERTYGGTPGGEPLGRAIASTPGGGLIIAGEEEVSVNRFRGWLMALSPEGNVLWERAPGHEGVNGFTAVSVLEDGSIVAGGDQDGGGWVVRLSSRGERLWDVRLPQLEHITALVSLPAQRVAVLGTAETSTTGLGISRLVMLESDGWAVWEKRLPAEGHGELAALALLPDGGLAAAGRLSRPGFEDESLWVVRMDSQGEPLWEHVPEGPRVEAGYALTALPDGGLAVTGLSWKDLLKEREAKVWRFAADGRLLWQQSYGGAENGTGTGIARLADDSLVVVGSTFSQGPRKTDLWIVGVSPNGQLLWEETFGGP